MVRRNAADDPTDPRHGSTAGYGSGCKCAECRAAMSAAKRAYHAYKADHPEPMDADTRTLRRRAAWVARNSRWEWQSNIDPRWDRTGTGPPPAVDGELAAILTVTYGSRPADLTVRVTEPDGPLPGECGTPGGWRRHRVEGTPLCPVCVAAQAAYRRTGSPARSPLPDGVHGTMRGYALEKNRAIEPCPACAAARAQYDRDRKQRRRATNGDTR